MLFCSLASLSVPLFSPFALRAGAAAARHPPAGVFLGRHKMAPSISPGKTWEGFGGSICASAIGSALLLYFLLDIASYWGLLFGLIFFVPLLGLAIGAASGALFGSMRDVGISDAFIREVREKITPGTSALFALTTGGVYGKVAAEFADGVLMAGDRRATMGNLISQRDIEKVFVTDGYSSVGIAGTAGIGIELVRVFAVELEHYEKIEGVPLSLDGKVNKLAGMVRGNLGAALQGFAALPLFVGFDEAAADPTAAGRIVR